MNENEVGVFNPDTKDFSITYDINGDKNPPLFTVPAGDHAFFVKGVADHIKSHLAKHLVFSRGIKTNFEDEYKAALVEVSYDI